MNENHIIRVIIQGYDRLSGVLKNAASNAGPSLDGLTDRLRRNKNEASEASSAVTGFVSSLTASDGPVERARSRIDRFANSLRVAAGQSRQFSETAEQMFDRLGRQGDSPRGAGGRFLSRSEFVDQENQRRLQIAAIDSENNAIKRLSRAYKELKLDKRVVVADDIARGLQAGLARDENLERASRAQIRLQEQERLAANRAELIREQATRRAEARQQREEVENIQRIQIEALRAREQARRDAFESERQATIQARRAEEAERRAELDANLQDLERLSRSRAKANQERRVEARAEILERRAALRNEFELERAADEEVFNRRQRRIEIVHRGRMAQIAQQHRAELASLTEIHATASKLQDEEFKERGRKIAEEADRQRRDIPGQIRAQNEGIFNFPELAGVELAAARVGRAFREIGRGFRGGRRDLVEFRDEAGRAQNVFARLGAGVGRATTGIGQFINVRWLFIIGILQTLLTLLIQLGAALVAIAASALTAGAALGGALAAGAAQAAPVIGLLAATFSRLENAMKVLELRERERDAATEDARQSARSRQNAADQLADAQYALARAVENVGDAERGVVDAHDRVRDAMRNQREAQEGLTEARRDAARAIVDASLEEREARLSLQEAELGVLDAKQALLDFEERRRRGTADLEQAQAEVREAQDRLRLARQQGDAAEIAAANSALSVAQSNINNIKDQISNTDQEQRRLQLNIQRSELAVEQARVRRNRATDENRVRRDQGVEGSPEVEAANDRLRNATRTLRDAILDIAVAERRRADAIHSVAIANRNIIRAQRDVQDALLETSAAQRQVDQEWDKLSESERRFVLAAERLQEKWREVSTPITDILVDAVTRGLTRAMVLLDDADIQDAFEDLAGTVAEIADQFTKWLISPEAREFILFFIREAKDNLPIVAEAAGDLGISLLRIAQAASPVLTDLLEWVRDLAGGLRDATSDSEGLEDFFESAGKHLFAWLELGEAVGNFLIALTGASASEGLSMVEDITNAFNEWADWIRQNPEAVEGFFRRIHESLEEILPLVGRFLGELVRAFTSGEFQAFTQFVLETMLPALLDVIRVLGLVAKGLQTISEVPIIGQLVKLIVHWGLVFIALKRLFPLISGVIALFSLRRFVIIAAIVLLIEHWDKLSASIKRVKEWFDELPGPIKILVGVLGGGVAGAGLAGVLFLASRRFRNLITAADPLPGKLGKISSILTGGRGLVGLLGRAGLAGAALAAGYGIGQLLLKIPGLERGLKNLGGKIADIVSGSSSLRGAAKALGIDFGDEAGYEPLTQTGREEERNYVRRKYRRLRAQGVAHDEAVEILKGQHPGNSNIIPRMLEAYRNRNVDQIPRFQGGGEVKGTQGRAVPAIVHAGEWVVNKEQQLRLANRMRTTVREAGMFLFGTQGMSPAASAAGGRPTFQSGESYKGRNFELVPHKDDYGMEIWFMKMRDGTWGQVTSRAAEKIVESGGSWFPGYVKRRQGMNNPRYYQMLKNSYASGGVVSFSNPAIQSFASGGVVKSPMGSTPGRGGNVVHQTFDVKTQGDSDWHHIMKMAANAAQEGF